MSLLVPFLTVLLVLLVVLVAAVVPSLVVLLVAYCRHPWSLFMALLVALVLSPMPLLVPAGHRGGVSNGMLTLLVVSLVCVLLLPPPMAAPVAPIPEPALSLLPSPAPCLQRVLPPAWGRCGAAGHAERAEVT